MTRMGCLLVMGLALGAQAPDRPARSVGELKAFFQANCVKCHGVDGSARDAQGRPLRGRDFTNAREMRGESDAGLVKTIRKGIFFGRVMPSYKDQLTEGEALTLVQEVVRKAKRGVPVAPDPVPASK